MPLSIVYVLTNPAMPGLVKIGRTSYEEANTRIAQLYSTGVPFPFKLEFACKVENPDEVEQALHLAFGPSRVNARREFFSIEPEQAIAILKLLHVPDATLEVELAPSPIGTQEINAGAEFAARRPNLNFEEMGIPIGSQLLFTESDASVIVSTPKKVKRDDVDISLSAATPYIVGVGLLRAARPVLDFQRAFPARHLQ